MSESASPPPPRPGSFPERTLAHLQVVDAVEWGLILAISLLALVLTLMKTDFSSREELLQLAAIFGLALVPAGFTAGHALAARGLYEGRPYGRRLLSLFSWTGLVRIPFGTVASILTLRMLGREEAQERGVEPLPAPAKARPIVIFWALWNAEIVCFLVFVVIVNVLAGVSASKRKRTMSDMRSIATAVEAYAIDYDAYPKARSLAELLPLISPMYIKNVPPRDGWNHEFKFETSADQKSYVLVSAGADGRFEKTDVWSYPEAISQDDGIDIVFRDGRFVRYLGHVHHPED